ncbi:LuxR C-terminal-related transcriptional regulator [Streptomyces diastatochromogenes]|nr:LuxR C-terminal-related transcriptional regulator [Streptomyces diastatochromogenes]
MTMASPTHAADDVWPWADEGDPEWSWLPHSRTVPVPCGTYFDAVRMPADIAAPVLRRLGSGTGPVLANDVTRVWWFLLPRGEAEPGLWAPGVRLLRRGTVIGVPPREVTGGKDVHWVVTPGTQTTSADRLRAALNAADATPSLPVLHPAARPVPASMRLAPTPATATLPFTPRPLTPTQLRTGRLLLAGKNNQEIATELQVSVTTVRDHLKGIGYRAGGTTPAGRAAALLAGGHLPPPQGAMTPPVFTADDLALIRAVAELSHPTSVPMHLRDAEEDHLARLRQAAGARSNAHLVALVWTQLTAVQSRPMATSATGA